MAIDGISSGLVSGDVPCVACGYNLRMQPTTGLCPECAQPVAHSMDDQLLLFAAPEWVRKLRSGVTFLLVAVIGSVALPVLGVALALGASSAGIKTLLIVVALVIGGVALCGVGLFTSPHPRRREPPRRATSRWLARVCLGVLVLVMLAGGLFSFAAFASMFVAGVTGMGVAAALALAVAWHTGVLMKQIPRRGLVLYSRILFWLLLANVTVSLGAAIAQVVAWRSYMTTLATVSAAATATTLPTRAPAVIWPPMPASLMVIGAIQYLNLLASLGIGIAGIVLFILVRRALTDVGKRAEAYRAGG